MARYAATIESSMRSEDAFDYMAMFTNAAEWDPNVVEASRLDTGELRVGSAFRIVSRFAGRSVALRYEITAYDAGRRVVLKAWQPAFGSVDTITVEPWGEGSRVTYDALLIPKGIARLAGPLFSLVFKRVGDAAAASLRRRLGGERAHPLEGEAG